MRHLSRIVDDLIDVSRIAERKIELHRQRVALASLVENAVETCRAYVESRRHPLTVTLPSEPLYLDADPVRLIAGPDQSDQQRGQVQRARRADRADRP